MIRKLYRRHEARRGTLSASSTAHALLHRVRPCVARMLRQRRPLTDVLEPLLGDESAANEQHSFGGRLWSSAAGVYTLAVAAASAVIAYVFWCSPSAAAPPLSDDEEEAVERLRQRALLPFDASDEAHVKLLHQLWARTYTTRPLPAPRGPHWSEMGWQGVDPSTDLRAAGLLAAQVRPAPDTRCFFTVQATCAHALPHFAPAVLAVFC